MGCSGLHNSHSKNRDYLTLSSSDFHKLSWESPVWWSIYRVGTHTGWPNLGELLKLYWDCKFGELLRLYWDCKFEYQVTLTLNSPVRALLDIKKGKDSNFICTYHHRLNYGVDNLKININGILYITICYAILLCNIVTFNYIISTTCREKKDVPKEMSLLTYIYIGI